MFCTGKGSKDRKGSKSVPADPVAKSESELEGLVGSGDFDRISYGPAFVNDMSTSQIDEDKTCGHFT